MTRKVWWRKSKDGQCHYAAMFEIDSIKLCSRHASMLALENAIREGTAVKIEEPKYALET